MIYFTSDQKILLELLQRLTLDDEIASTILVLFFTVTSPGLILFISCGDGTCGAPPPKEKSCYNCMNMKLFQNQHQKILHHIVSFCFLNFWKLFGGIT